MAKPAKPATGVASTPAPTQPQKSGLQKAVDWVTKWAILIAIIAVVVIFAYNLKLKNKSHIKESVPRSAQNAEQDAPQEKKTPWVVINLGKPEPTPKPPGKEVKIRTSTAKWSPVFETKVGESVTYSFPGRVAVRTNVSYGGGKVFQYDDKLGKYYELGRNNLPLVEELTGKPVTTLNLGDNVSELEFLSLDVDKVVTVVVTR